MSRLGGSHVGLTLLPFHTGFDRLSRAHMLSTALLAIAIKIVFLVASDEPTSAYEAPSPDAQMAVHVGCHPRSRKVATLVLSAEVTLIHMLVPSTFAFATDARQTS